MNPYRLSRRPALRLFGLAVLVALSACAPQPQAPRASFEPARARVALLLPLSGPNAGLGRSLQQAAELALFDEGHAGVDFLPRDTTGTAGGAAEAARGAVSAGARIIIGPLTAAETSAASGAARAGRVPVLAFTNDAGQAGPGIWILGVTPAQQVRRVAGHAAAQGARRFAMVAPDDAFGRALAAGLRSATDDLDLPAPTVLLHPARAEMGMLARELTQRAGPDGLDALLIGESGQGAREFATALGAAGTDLSRLRIMGHAGWAQDATLGLVPALHGAIFAAPDAAARASFEGRYLSAFGEQAPRIASVAYDAARLAARAAAQRGQIGGGETAQGVDGPMRLLPDGRVLRGLALYAVSPGGEPRRIEAAAMAAPGS